MSSSDASDRIKGFAAGTMSGLTKLIVGQPLDMVKVRLQVSAPGTYKGPIDVATKLVSREGIRSFYKGASAPAVGWAISDSMLMGSLHNYRLWLGSVPLFQRYPPGSDPLPAGSSSAPKVINLNLLGHFVSGGLAGMTVCAVATPTELVKSKLQMQLHASRREQRQFSGPIDVVKQVVRKNGPLGMWHSFGGTLLFRIFTTYEITMRQLRQQPSLSAGASNFIAGGVASLSFWTFSFPFDAVRNRRFADDLHKPRYPTWLSAARQIYAEAGPKAFYRGFSACVLRAIPTNAAALYVWETTMRLLNASQVK